MYSGNCNWNIVAGLELYINIITPPVECNFAIVIFLSNFKSLQPSVFRPDRLPTRVTEHFPDKSFSLKSSVPFNVLIPRIHPKVPLCNKASSTFSNYKLMFHIKLQSFI